MRDACTSSDCWSAKCSGSAACPKPAAAREKAEGTSPLLLGALIGAATTAGLCGVGGVVVWARRSGSSDLRDAEGDGASPLGTSYGRGAVSMGQVAADFEKHSGGADALKKQGREVDV